LILTAHVRLYPHAYQFARPRAFAVARRPLSVRDCSVSPKPALRPDDAGGERAPMTLPLEFDRVFRLHAPYVGALVLKLIGRPGYVDDVVQDVFIQAHRGLARLRPPAGPAVVAAHHRAPRATLAPQALGHAVVSRARRRRRA